MGEEISFDLKNYVRKNPIIKRQNIKAPDSPVPSENRISSHWYPPESGSHKAYSSLSVEDITLRLGHQRYVTGTGYWWTPTDLFNSRHTLSPLYETEGLDSAFMSYAFGEDHEVEAFYSFGNRICPETIDGDYRFRMKTHTEVADLAIHYTEMKQNRTDYEGLINGSLEAEEATIPVRWKLLAAGLSSSIAGVGIHAEGGHAWLSLDKETEEAAANIFAKDHSRFLVGIDYTFENELYLVLEYFQEGQGKTSPDEYTINDRLAYLSGESETIGRDNLFVGAKYPIAEMTSIELYNIINANDPSVIVNPWLIWSTGEDFTLKFSAQFPVGKEESSVNGTGPSAFAHIQLNF